MLDFGKMMSIIRETCFDIYKWLEIENCIQEFS